MPPCRGYKYLQVLIDAFTGWIEAFPPRTEKATEVAKAFLKEIIPQFGLPRSLQSEMGHPSLLGSLKQSEALGIKYYLHSTLRPQSSGEVEWVNQTLKRTLAKLCQETSENCTKWSPKALMRIKGFPKANVKLSPFEMLYGQPFLSLDLIFDTQTRQAIKYIINRARAKSFTGI